MEAEKHNFIERFFLIKAEEKRLEELAKAKENKDVIKR
jgi:hypothetical protein